MPLAGSRTASLPNVVLTEDAVLGLAGSGAAAVMSLIQSAKLNGHDPYRYLKDVLQRLPTQRASHIEELLPHRWVPVEIS